MEYSLHLFPAVPTTRWRRVVATPRKVKIEILVLPVLLAGVLPGRAQQLILNGSFETPVVGTATITILGLGVIVPGTETFVAPNNGITDWLVTMGTVTLVDNGNTVVNTLGLPTAPDGVQYAVLNGLNVNPVGGAITASAVGTLTQSFATTAGSAYQLSFDYSGIGVTLGNSSGLQVAVSNSRSSTAPNGGGTITVGANNFQNETFDFVATGTSSTLSFDEPAGALAHSEGVGLDDVSVTNLGMVPVPEFPHYAGGAMAFLFVLMAGRMGSRWWGKSSAGCVAASPK
jgi:hypothetical protein